MAAAVDVFQLGSLSRATQHQSSHTAASRVCQKPLLSPLDHLPVRHMNSGCLIEAYVLQPGP